MEQTILESDAQICLPSYGRLSSVNSSPTNKADKIMGKRPLTTCFTITISVVLLVLFATPVPASKMRDESNLRGGWQIWIAAVDFDRCGAKGRFLKRGKEAGQINAPAPVLAGDFLFSTVDANRVIAVNGHTEYDFEIRQEGAAYIYARVMDFAGAGGWYVILNHGKIDAGLKISSKGAWKWRTDDRGALSRQKLFKGKNTMRIIPLGPGRGEQVLMDIFMVLTVKFEPKDLHYKQAKRLNLAVEPDHKLTTTWATLKNDF